ncbi:response regulator [Tropicibacter sp. S64]|uniref:response regulator n=1 Tax=Tropicibacter sp. S64 TaxID=3415122 RepID=UPI003C7A21E5
MEDDDGDAKAVSRALARSPVRTVLHRVSDGIEALKLMRARGSALADTYIVLADLNMPRMNGIEFLAELRRDPILRRTVVFMVSTSDSEEDRNAAYNFSVAGFSPKHKLGKNLEKLIKVLDDYARIVDLPRMP